MRRRRDTSAVQAWTAVSDEARRHFRRTAGQACNCSACWFLRANGLVAPPDGPTGD